MLNINIKKSTIRELKIVMTTAITTATVVLCLNALEKKPEPLNIINKNVFNLYSNVSESSNFDNLYLYDYSFEDFNQTYSKPTNEITNVKMEKADLGLKSLESTNSIAKRFVKGKTGIPNLQNLNKLSEIYSIPRNLLYSLMLKESQGDLMAESNKSARGLFQFLPSTAKQYGLIINDEKDERINPWKSADASARYLAWIFTYLHNDKDRTNIDNYKYVLASYNAGIGKVKRNGKLFIPNIKETIDYVNFIIGHAKGDFYLVKIGDRLHKIAEIHNLDTKKLSVMNKGVSQQKLIAGKYLLVNVNKFENKHIVNKGDSLYAIAKAYSVSLKDLKMENNLTDNIIGVGQKIKIPL